MEDDNKQIIFILDDEEGITKLFEGCINKKIPDVVVYSFNKTNSMMEHPLIKDVSLFIIDIELDFKNVGHEVANELFKNKLKVPYLFISGQPYDFECFSKYEYTYDFIEKPCNMNKLMNRIAVLLKVSKVYKRHEKEESNLKMNLRDLFDYTNFYMLILDCEMNITTCSYKLAKDLGYISGSDLTGLNWIQFVREKDKENIITIHKNVVKDTETYQKNLREYTNKILTKTNTSIEVKWFNARIKNGHIYSFSIGIPYNREVSVNDEIESIRAYWKYVIDKDETTLQALKHIG